MNNHFRDLFVLCFSFAFSFVLHSQSGENKISGIVTDVDGPKPQVNVTIKGTFYGVQTDSLGRYAVKASPKDIVVFSHVGMKTEEIIVEDVTRVLNIRMESSINKLEEVVVTKRKRKTQDYLKRNYFSDSSIVRSNMGYLSPAAVGYELRFADGKDLNKSARDILDAIAKQLPGVTVRENVDGRFLYGKSFGTLRGSSRLAFEVDGKIYKESPVWLDISAVLRVAIIPPKQAIYGYGPIGGGGMVVINTKSTKFGLRDRDGRPFDLARVTNNIYENDALDNQGMQRNDPDYLKQLYKSERTEEALAIYKHYKSLYGGSYSFVLDVYTLLLEKFKDSETAKKVLLENTLLFQEDPVALKALAYIYESHEKFNEAHEMYRRIYKMRPEYVQSYMNLANSYRDIGDFRQASFIYARYEHLKDIGFLLNDSTSFVPIIDREWNNLMMLKGKEVFALEDGKEHVWEEDFDGTRLVFEWNNGEAEFELQFVNPLGSYYTKEHSREADSQRIKDEKLTGYSCEEYLIDKSLNGDWQVNVRYLGNKSLTPTYLKTTIYYDYGKMSQKKQVKVFKLGVKGPSQQLFRLHSSGKLAAK